MFFVFVIKQHIQILSAFLSLITSYDCNYNDSCEVTLIRSYVIKIDIIVFLKYIYKYLYRFMSLDKPYIYANSDQYGAS